jgi:hypothetical protein
MKYSKHLFGLILVMLFFSCSEDKFLDGGKGIVKGRVVDEKTFEPIGNARISSSPNSSKVFTDDAGYFVINDVIPGEYAFEAKKNGYLAKFEGVTVNAGSVSEVVFELEISTSDNRPPQIPILTTPVDNADNQGINLGLTWTATDPDDDILTFQLILRNDANNEVVTYSNITTPNFALTNLSFSTKYYWQVSASDGINAPVFSETKSFKTIIFPDARYLFVKKIGSNNVIFTADDSGNQLQITTSQTNSFRPRKNTQYDKIAFIRTDGAQGHIYTMNPDGSDVFKVTSSIPVAGFNYDYMNFSWNANGSQIIYPYFDKLYRINRDGSGLTMIFQTPNGKFISECDWSINGSVIALKVNDNNGYNVEIYTISSVGAILNTILSGVTGAAGGLHLSVDNQKLIFTRDVSGFESGDYRQLDSRIFMHNFTTNITSELTTQRPSGTNDLDVRFSPNEADIIFVNTSNDGLSARNVVKYSIGATNSRAILYTNATMPDWK